MNTTNCCLLSHTRSTFSSSTSPSSLACHKRSTAPVDDQEEPLDSRLQVLHLISDSKYPLYVVKSPSYEKKLCMKVFRNKKCCIVASFANESRFLTLNHPNVIRILEAKDGQTLYGIKKEPITASILLMELAICDFSVLVTNPIFNQNEKLVRTYFRQLVEGLEYLHSEGVFHLDLKPGNLLLGQDYRLKITDFDLSYQKDDVFMIGYGTKNFRAPELASRKCKKPQMADIYSLGIILFVMMTGAVPYFEDALVNGHDLYKSFLEEIHLYWLKFDVVTYHSYSLSEDFKQLLSGLVAKEPRKRFSIQQIKESRWYNGPVCTLEELRQLIKTDFPEILLSSKCYC